jgi:hypothetical protein
VFWIFFLHDVSVIVPGRIKIENRKVLPLIDRHQINSNLNIVTRESMAAGIPITNVRSSSCLLDSRSEAGFAAKLGVEVKDGIFACSRSRRR